MVGEISHKYGMCHQRKSDTSTAAIRHAMPIVGVTMKNLCSTIFVLLTLACSAAHAQVYKCKNAQGKMEYSDIPCAGTESQKVNIVAPDFGNTDGSSEARAQLLQANRLKSGPTPAECKFNYFAQGDSKGRTLAENAKAECIENMMNKAKGAPASTEAYNLWREHYSATSNNRNATVARVNATENANRITRQLRRNADDADQNAQEANRNARDMNQKLDDLQNKTYRCRRSLAPGEVECR